MVLLLCLSLTFCCLHAASAMPLASPRTQVACHPSPVGDRDSRSHSAVPRENATTQTLQTRPEARSRASCSPVCQHRSFKVLFHCYKNNPSWPDSIQFYEQDLFQQKIMKNYNLLLVRLQVNQNVLFRNRAPTLFRGTVYLSFKQEEVLLRTQMEDRFPHQNKLLAQFLSPKERSSPKERQENGFLNSCLAKINKFTLLYLRYFKIEEQGDRVSLFSFGWTGTVQTRLYIQTRLSSSSSQRLHYLCELALEASIFLFDLYRLRDISQLVEFLLA